MKHRTRCFGAAVLAALVLAMLCVPALAAEIVVDYTSEYQFSAADFSDSSELEGVYISAVPPAYQAELCIGSRVLRRGDILPAAALEKLKLRPVCLGEADCELVYCPISAGTLGDAVTVSLRILSGTNTAPVCEDGTLETYKNIANSGTLCAQDKEDTKLTYQLVKEPKRGTVELHDDGSFTYTPGKNKVGKDSFVFTATDPAGNVSNEACVKIRILKPADKATYQDMSGDKDAFAAMWLKDQGLYTGRIIAGNLCFEPDDAVSRGEFLIACMKLAGLEQADGAISTGFADELETPAWQQPYLAAAYQSGMISGTPTEEGLVFRPEDTLSRAEAAVMLQKLLRVLDAVQRITREARDLLRDDKVKHSPLGIRDHPQKAVPFVGAGAGNALVYVSGDVRPVGIFLNKLCVVLNLVFQTALLLHLLSRNAGVEGYTQRQVINRLALPHLLSQPSNCHHGYRPPQPLFLP